MESKTSFCSKISNDKKKKNPYSNRGLEKFSALVAELEEKRQRILSRSGSENIALVRFVYKDSNNCIPVVVKTKHNTDDDDKINFSVVDNNSSSREIGGQFKKKKKKKMRGLVSLEPVPVAVLLIMLLLAFFGRSFAIICASIMWYAIPKKKVVNDDGSCFSPNYSWNLKDGSPRKFGRRKSW